VGGSGIWENEVTHKNLKYEFTKCEGHMGYRHRIRLRNYLMIYTSYITYNYTHINRNRHLEVTIPVHGIMGLDLRVNTNISK
jgi:hypothetical protein